MDLTKVIIRAELCSSAEAAISRRDRQLTEKLNSAIYSFVHSTPMSTTGQPIPFDGSVKNLLLTETVLAPSDETIKKRFPGYNPGQEIPVTVRTFGLIFQTGDTEGVESVLNRLAEDDTVSSFAGVSWKYFDPETDIPD